MVSQLKLSKGTELTNTCKYDAVAHVLIMKIMNGYECDGTDISMR